MRSEIERFFPEEDIKGIVVIDYAVHSKIKKGIDLSLSLSKEKDPVYFKDTITNHRYTNPLYTTLSKKAGKKNCRIGYPVNISIKESSEYKYIHLKLKILDQQEITATIPVNINLTKQKNVALLSIRAVWSLNKVYFQIENTVHKKPGYRVSYTYAVGDTELRQNIKKLDYKKEGNHIESTQEINVITSSLNNCFLIKAGDNKIIF